MNSFNFFNLETTKKLKYNMEENKLTIKSTILTYGLILGGISVAFNLMLYFLDMHYQQNAAAGYVGIALMIGVLMYAFIVFKKHNEGYLSLSEALKIGLGISLIAGLIGVLYAFVLTEFLDPDMMNKALDLQFEKMRVENPEMSQEQLDMSREMADKFSSPLIRSAFQLIGALFIGFIISLIGGLIVKKSRPE
ncbi:MAG: DUF4199 domain-containing protein [Flavobacteriia bacterium]|nr:DUF4199 domain-containing protein [Flavobacteriia bacterium]